MDGKFIHYNCFGGKEDNGVVNRSNISPNGLRVMVLRSWRTLICRLEAPKGQRSQRSLKRRNYYLNGKEK
jgi:hypothetical protein